MLDSMAVISGFAAVGSTLEIGAASFGGTVASVFSDTDLGSTGALLTIDGFSGRTDGRVGAFGPNAVTMVTGATDPGEIYQVDEGGELVLTKYAYGNPGPVNAGFHYPELARQRPVAERHLRVPRSRRHRQFAAVQRGDRRFHRASRQRRRLGHLRRRFDRRGHQPRHHDVQRCHLFVQRVAPTGYVASTDPTGLERITFASPQGVAFQQAITTGGEYLWSNAANWTNGAPPDVGAAVTFDVSGPNNPSGYDDIANLMLDSMAVINGFAAVGTTLEIGAASFGSTVASVFSDTDLGSTGALLTIDGFTGASDGRVGAFGVNAFTLVNGATDPGEIYQVDEGGELVLDATPHGSPGPVNAGFYYQNSHGTGQLPSGTFAFRDPGATVTALLSNAAIGDSIALPGSDVASVSFGASSIAVVTNLGTTTFSDVTYFAGAQPTGYVASTDPTGLERVTIASPQGVAFQQAITTGGEYLWSNAANWTNGAPPDVGAAVTFNVVGPNNPSGYDDIANLMLDSMAVITRLPRGYRRCWSARSVPRVSAARWPACSATPTSAAPRRC